MTYEFNAVCVKQSKENALICGKTIHGYSITIIYLLTSLLVYEFLAKKQHGNDAQAYIFARYEPV